MTAFSASLRVCVPFSEAGGSGPPGDLLVVRHGRGRGPYIRLRSVRPARFQPTIDGLARRCPQFAPPLRCWNTGEPPLDLEGVRAVVFQPQDPLRERFSVCFDEASDLAERARQGGLRIVNPPEALSNSIKSMRARLWLQAGLPTPARFLFENHEQLRAAIREVSFPAILRAGRLHSQARMFHLESREDALNLGQDAITLPDTLSPVVDTREGFCQADPGSAWARFCYKKRAFVFGRHVMNNHVLFGREPIVAAKSCTFSRYRSLNPIRRLRGRLACGEHVALPHVLGGFRLEKRLTRDPVGTLDGRQVIFPSCREWSHA